MSWAAWTTYHYRIFVALMFSNLLYPMIPKPTHITSNTTSLIDNIFTNNVTCLSVNGPILNDLSDHLQFLFFSISRGNFDYDTFYALIGQNLTGVFTRELFAAPWNLFSLTAEADRVLCQLVMFVTVFFHWMYKMKFSCYQESSVIHG